MPTPSRSSAHPPTVVATTSTPRPSQRSPSLPPGQGTPRPSPSSVNTVPSTAPPSAPSRALHRAESVASSVPGSEAASEDTDTAEAPRPTIKEGLLIQCVGWLPVSFNIHTHTYIYIHIHMLYIYIELASVLESTLPVLCPIEVSECAAQHRLRRLCLRGKNGKLKVPLSVHEAYKAGGTPRDDLLAQLANLDYDKACFMLLLQLKLV